MKILIMLPKDYEIRIFLFTHLIHETLLRTKDYGTRMFCSYWSLYRHFVVLSWQARCSDVILQESTEEFMFYG